jgi:hypothetical protein
MLMGHSETRGAYPACGYLPSISFKILFAHSTPSAIVAYLSANTALPTTIPLRRMSTR